MKCNFLELSVVTFPKPDTGQILCPASPPQVYNPCRVSFHDDELLEMFFVFGHFFLSSSCNMSAVKMSLGAIAVGGEKKSVVGVV
ncbi:hypothetical protein TNCV_3251521 [Trichonephila clavipes]|nr:hypothetical protein TNCV_3251521 [Trichonephila clavipes]